MSHNAVKVFGWLYIGLVIAIGPAIAKPGKISNHKPALKAPAHKKALPAVALMGTKTVLK
jgi:hypothetical protein